MLPGDEIVEKKHANIKMLTAQMESADLSKRSMRKWPGLGANGEPVLALGVRKDPVVGRESNRPQRQQVLQPH